MLDVLATARGRVPRHYPLSQGQGCDNQNNETISPGF